jgi:hypothetical protein
MMDWEEKIAQVTDLDSFLAFVDALVEDRKINPLEWQNDSIEAYLESSAAWARDSKGLPISMDARPSWQALANFLYSGKIYE